MKSGRIEELRYPRNPLDVLAQQIVAMVAMDSYTVDEVLALVRRAANFAGLPRPALESVLDMLSGRYPSDAFAELRPRLVWDRLTGELTADDLLIGKDGQVTGVVNAREIDVHGELNQDIVCREHILIHNTGRVSGTLEYSELEIQRGGQFRGNMKQR